MLLKNRVSIITGGGSGIGRAICVEFSREGAIVVVCNRSKQTGKKTVELANEAGRKTGGKAIHVPADVRDSEEVKNLINKTIDSYGKIDVLVNNAGVNTKKKIENLTEKEWDYVVDTNLKGHFLCTKHAIPYLKNSEAGVIINMSSILGYVGLAKKGPYCASKSAIIALTRVMALELAPYNIRVNVLSPGSIDTPMLWGNLPQNEIYQARQQQAEAHPVGYIANPEQIGRAAVWLASREVDFIHGTSIIIDGGSIIKPPGEL